MGETYDVEEIYVLTWEDRPGAEVRARSLSTGELLEWSAKEVARREATTDPQERRNVVFYHAAEFLSEVVESWTLTRRGEPIPVTPAGCMLIGSQFLMKIYRDYFGASVEVPEASDLGKDFDSGEPYPEELQTTEAL